MGDFMKASSKTFRPQLHCRRLFYEHDTADKTAARLAKFGFSAVRLHFLTT